ncbi:hypothetical protein [Nostoc sp. CHAB 5715]|uniref:hypothetical protein n=1 Tax=Nostoc sp. CHAB 5715 TaxID=2780400 RepID=UPI001E432253|nr:hypothetical protein [Nostoc sp. CHAB 5715]MCC5624054.1 hypothetical protein [Nostoc sp. CHAB 5715]
MPSGEYKGVRRTITFPPEIFDKISELAKEDNRPFSQMVVKLLIEQLKQREKKEE